mgnify:CR=1 FL=1
MRLTLGNEKNKNLKIVKSKNIQNNKYNNLYNSISSCYNEIIKEKKESFVETKEKKEFKELEDDLDEMINSRNRSRRVEISKK